MIWLPGEFVPNQTAKAPGLFLSSYGLKCAETLVQHIKGGSWVNVNAEQPPTQAEFSVMLEGLIHPDQGGAAHSTPPGRAKVLST